jgi:lysozyme family protein
VSNFFSGSAGNTAATGAGSSRNSRTKNTGEGWGVTACLFLLECYNLFTDAHVQYSNRGVSVARLFSGSAGDTAATGAGSSRNSRTNTDAHVQYSSQSVSVPSFFSKSAGNTAAAATWQQLRPSTDAPCS